MARALIAFCVLALAGCGGGGGDGALTFQLFGDAEELKAYRDLVRGYERDSGRDVRLVEVPEREAHLAKLQTSFAGGAPPDVFLINYRNYGAYAERGVLEPAGPRLRRSEALRGARFHPLPLAAFTLDGVVQCLPQNASSLVTYYNRDLFRQAGVAEPGANWTYDEFLRAARRLNANGRHGVGVEPSLIRAAPFVWSAGGEVVDDTDRPTRLTLDSAAARQGLERLIALREEGLSPSAREERSKPSDERFLDGELAMFMSSRREVPTFRTIAEFDWDVAAFPRQREAASVLHSDAFCMSKGDRSGDAWRFVEYAAGPKGQSLLARSGRTVPSLERVASSHDFLATSRAPRSSRVFVDALRSTRRMPSISTWTQIEDRADKALERAYYGDLTLDRALERIESETADLFRRARR